MSYMGEDLDCYEYDDYSLVIENLKQAYDSLEEAIYGSGDYEDEELSFQIDKVRTKVWQFVEKAEAHQKEFKNEKASVSR